MEKRTFFFLYSTDQCENAPERQLGAPGGDDTPW